MPTRCSAGSDQLSTRSLQIVHNCLVRAIRQAEADDIIGRNVASLVRPPAGRDGRPSKAMSESQARALLDAAATGAKRANRGGGAPRPFRLHAYVVLLLTTGMRPEEARALRWDHLDLDAGTMSIWRSDRAGGDTKTSRSRRTLKMPAIAVAARRERSKVQAAEKLKAGDAWVNTGLVFTTALGTKLDQDNIRRDFRRITQEAGLGEDWVPRELRHTFVSILSAAGCRSKKLPAWPGHKADQHD